MAFQPAPDCAEAVINYILSGKAICNVLNFKSLTVIDQETVDDLALIVDDWVAESVLPQLTASCAYVETHVRGLESTVDFESINSDGAGPGLIAGAVMPNNVTFAVKLGTGQTGRSARGRFYWPGIAQAQRNANNTIGAVFADAMVDALSGLNIGGLAGGWQMVVLSRRNNNVTLTNAVARPVSTITYTDLRVDSQRRRLPDSG